MKHPGTRQASLINVDGENVHIEVDALKCVLGLRLPSVTINWWVSNEHNVVSEYTHEPLGCEIQTFWLDGLTPSESIAFASAVEATLARIDVPTRGLVVDYREATDADDWNSAILYGTEKVPGKVDLLLLGPEPAARILASSPSLSGSTREDGLTSICFT
ncbi:hypothetical protein [Streptomyces bungoensis]|uniref:hypothetical protein n=1 Tax=Streptomyces bungoensis TaxID=285568 RepID=UPI00342CB2AA